METSNQVDRERRPNERKKATWARHLVRARTVRIVFGTGAAVLKFFWWIFKIIDYFRD